MDFVAWPSIKCRVSSVPPFSRQAPSSRRKIVSPWPRWPRWPSHQAPGSNEKVVDALPWLHGANVTTVAFLRALHPKNKGDQEIPRVPRGCLLNCSTVVTCHWNNPLPSHVINVESWYHAAWFSFDMMWPDADAGGGQFWTHLTRPINYLLEAIGISFRQSFQKRHLQSTTCDWKYAHHLWLRNPANTGITQHSQPISISHQRYSLQPSKDSEFKNQSEAKSFLCKSTKIVTTMEQRHTQMRWNLRKSPPGQQLPSSQTPQSREPEATRPPIWICRTIGLQSSERCIFGDSIATDSQRSCCCS